VHCCKHVMVPIFPMRLATEERFHVPNTFLNVLLPWSPALATWGTPSRHGQKAALWYRHLARRIPGELLVNYYG
jgi:hypothetical protein